MRSIPQNADSIDTAIQLATKNMAISKHEWLKHGIMLKLIKQKSISDFF